MTESEKERIRRKISDEAWTKVGIIEPSPRESIENGEEVRVMYLDLNESLLIAKGEFHINKYNTEYFSVNGIPVAPVIAFKKLPKWTHICGDGFCTYRCGNCGGKHIIADSVCPHCKSEMGGVE